MYGYVLNLLLYLLLYQNLLHILAKKQLICDYDKFAFNSQENQNDWFTLQEVNQQKNSANTSDHTKLDTLEKDINKFSNNVFDIEEESTTDFRISKDTLPSSIPELNRMERLSLEHDMAPSPVSSRLTLQASIDGEISTNSESSVSGLKYFFSLYYYIYNESRKSILACPNNS